MAIHLGHRRAEFIGCPIDLLSMDETVALAVDAMRERRRLQHVCLNVAKLVSLMDDEELRRDVERSDVISIDGMGIVWGGRLLGLPIKERVTGIDLMFQVIAACETHGFRPYFLGCRQAVLEKALSKLKSRYPRLDIAGARNGYFSEAEEEAVAREIAAAKPDCLFIAISSPTKERFLHRWRDVIGVPFLMGVGGSLDVVAGHVTRAPLWMQRCGMEWLYRLLQEPRRMWRRYLYTNGRFSWILLKELATKMFQTRDDKMRGPAK